MRRVRGAAESRARLRGSGCYRSPPESSGRGERLNLDGREQAKVINTAEKSAGTIDSFETIFYRRSAINRN